MAGDVTLYRAAWVLPVSSPALADGAVLVGRDGRIAAVGPAAALEAIPDARIVELGEAALMPGLVNVHAHPELSGMRGLLEDPELSLFRGGLEDLRFRDWILRLVATKRSAMTDADFLTAARWTMVEALRGGMTTLAATESSAAGARAMREAM